MSAGLVADAGERLRVASRTPIDAFVPRLEDERYVANHTGNYWPFRYVRLKDALGQERAIRRTVDRCEMFRIDMGPGDPVAGPPCLYRLAEETGADEVLPRPLFTGRRHLMEVVDDYEQYDFMRRPRLVLPIGMPYGETTRIVVGALTEYGSGPENSPTNLGLFPPRGMSTETFVRGAQESRENVTGDTGIHLVDVHPTVELAAAIRDEPNLVDSVAIAPEAIDESEESAPGLSRAGRRDLRARSDPSVVLAADFSLLCSQYVEDDGFEEAAEKSVVPRAAEEKVS